MLRYIVRRLGQTLVTAVFVSMIVFGLARLTGDPAILLLPPEATEADRQFFRTQLGLDRSLPEQYLTFIGNARSEEHTSELQSLMRISYAVFSLKKKKQHKKIIR